MRVEMPQELRETRLRLRVDELIVRADKYRDANRNLRKRIEFKDAKIAALQREIRELAHQVNLLEIDLARRPL